LGNLGPYHQDRRLRLMPDLRRSERVGGEPLFVGAASAVPDTEQKRAFCGAPRKGPALPDLPRLGAKGANIPEQDALD
jgi:hypothetical protein